MRWRGLLQLRKPPQQLLTRLGYLYGAHTLLVRYVKCIHSLSLLPHSWIDLDIEHVMMQERRTRKCCPGKRQSC